MRFDNETALDARLFTGALDTQSLGAWLVARATYAVDRTTGTLTPAPCQWPVFHHRVQTAFGTFPSDDSPKHEGCDLVVLGSARCAAPVRQTVASFTVGAHRRCIDVIGDRRWVRRNDGVLVPSEPEPFTEMTLGWNRADGGTLGDDDDRTTHPLNPCGRGLCTAEEMAEGQLLPNLEDPSERIARWSDTPTPAAWGPIAKALPWQVEHHLRARGTDAPPLEDAAFAEVVRNATEAASPPRNVIGALRGDERVELRLGDDAWRFVLPGLALRLDVEVGAQRFATRVSVSGLWFLADTQLLVVSWRSRFRYRMRPREERRATLRAMPAEVRPAP